MYTFSLPKYFGVIDETEEFLISLFCEKNNLIFS